MKRRSAWLLAYAFPLLLLASCGGGGGGNTSAGTNTSTGGGPIVNGDTKPEAPIATLSLWAGSDGGFGNLDGKGNDARFWEPASAAVDSQGNLFVVDNYLNTIRKITPDGTVSTFAGTSGRIGSADGMGADASFNFDKPSGITIDSNNNLYVADVGNHLIRKIAPSGLVTTIAGRAGESGNIDGIGSQARLRFCFEEIGCIPPGMAVDSTGTLYFVEHGNQKIRKITPAGEVRTVWGQICGYGIDSTDPATCYDLHLTGLAIGPDDRLYISEYSRIRVMGTDGRMQPYAGAKDVAGTLDGMGTNAGFSRAHGLTADANGNLYVLDHMLLRKVARDTTVTTIAGDPSAWGGGSADGKGKLAQFSFPTSLATDRSGMIYVVDSDNQTIRKATPDGDVTTFAGKAAVAGAADGVGMAARFAFIEGMVFDTAGNLFVSDEQNRTIRKITPAAAVSTFAGRAGEHGRTDGIGSEARFFGPSSIVMDSAGNLLVADIFNNAIRKISPNGMVSTPPGPRFQDGGTFPTASALYQARGIAIDANDNLFVADTMNNVIRKIDNKGVASTFAGQVTGSAGAADGAGPLARFFYPFALITDRAGNVFVADTYNHAIRKITPAGVVSTFAGSLGNAGFADGPGSQALFAGPKSMAIDAADNLYVADTFNHLVRKITPTGVVTTVVGTPGLAGFRAGSLPGSLLFPTALALKGRSLYIATSKGIAVATNIP